MRIAFKESSESTNLSKNGYFYKNNVPQQYIDVVVPTKEVYTSGRFYWYSKTVPRLKANVVTAISTRNGHVHFCVVYSLSGAKPDEVVEISCAFHGNSKQSR